MAAATMILILSIAGFLDSLYMTLVYYGRINPHLSLVPTVTNPENGTCKSVVQTPEARVFGIQNSVLGLAYYVVMFAAAVVRLAVGTWPFFIILTIISVMAALFSIYLAWALIFRLRTPCPLCFTAQAINIAIAIILITSI